jgi:hypothetical protein
VAAPNVTFAVVDGVGIDGVQRSTEDRVVHLPHAVVLADGATALRPGDLSGGWYADHLCEALTDLLTATPAADLRDVLAAAIAKVADDHGLIPGAAPSSTVAMLRWTDTELHGLVLADSPVVVFTDQGPELLADERLATVAAPGSYRQRLREGGGYGPAHEAALRASGARTSSLRNVDGGFWVAEADPAAAARAQVATWPRHRVGAALLASDGMSCGVDDYHLFDWPQVLDHAVAEGPAAVLATVWSAEAADPDGARWPRAKRHDDKTLVLVRF